ENIEEYILAANGAKENFELFGGNLDSRRSSTLSFGIKGACKSVKILLLSFPEMCLAVDGDGNNPSHLAAMKGRVDVLKELLRALKFLIEFLKNEELVDTVMMTSMCTPLRFLTGIIQYLIANNQIDRLQIVHVHSLQLSSTQRSQQTSSSATVLNNNQDLSANNKYDKTYWLEKQRNSIMVVASLIAAMAFQAGISPRGSFWQDDSDTHKAGNPIWKDKEPNSYNVFLISNTICFLSSLSIIVFLISGLPLTHNLVMWILTLVMWISISATTVTYGVSVGSLDGLVISLVEGWMFFMFVLIMVHTIRFVFHRTSHWTVKRRVILWICLRVVYICVMFLLPIGTSFILSA
ncbi:hypothetical protein Leryth_015732, partial [Lithospermum erythrorhizon]